MPPADLYAFNAKRLREKKLRHLSDHTKYSLDPLQI